MPTPQNVVDAVQVIAAHLREGGHEQAIISKSGGASFRLTNVFDELAYWQSAADAANRPGCVKCSWRGDAVYKYCDECFATLGEDERALLTIVREGYERLGMD